LYLLKKNKEKLKKDAYFINYKSISACIFSYIAHKFQDTL